MFEYCSIWPTYYLCLRELARFPEPPVKSEVKTICPRQFENHALVTKKQSLMHVFLAGTTGKILKREGGRLAEHYLPEVVPGY